MNIQEDYVSFETAKLLKDKGFNVPCRNYYSKGGVLRCGTIYSNSILNPVNATSAPTLQMACKWLREVHKLGIFPSTYTNITRNNTIHVYGTAIVNLNTYELMTSDYMARDTYNEACETAIKYCLEHLI